MARVGGEKMRELEVVLHEAAGRLSPGHVAALVAHPDAVRSALAVAAVVLTVNDKGGSGFETIAGAEPVRAGDEEAARRMAERSREGRARNVAELGRTSGTSRAQDAPVSA